MTNYTDNINIRSVTPLPAPEEMKAEYPATSEALDVVVSGRAGIEAVLERKDDRKLIIVGPCSIHDVQGTLAYAEKLRRLAEEVSDHILIVMRVYFEKPRTVLGWKGLIYDPDLNESHNITRGLKLARQTMLEVSKLGLPTATEILEPIVPQYIADLVSWAAIGARTAESQTHRQMASGLSMPIGFKNATDGSMEVAVEGIRAAGAPHTFIGITGEGYAGQFNTRGNDSAHLVLRGGKCGPNYTPEYVAFARKLMQGKGLIPNIMIDCSHGNSEKEPRNQVRVAENVIEQVLDGDRDIIGLMLESNIHPGKQRMTEGAESLEIGRSITDPCLGWDETASLIRDIHRRLAQRG